MLQIPPHQNFLDPPLGSVAYISDECDDFRVKIAGSDKVGNKNEKVVSNLKREFEQIVSRQNYTEEQLDNPEQYGRPENLEIMVCQLCKTKIPTKLSRQWRKH